MNQLLTTNVIRLQVQVITREYVINWLPMITRMVIGDSHRVLSKNKVSGRRRRWSWTKNSLDFIVVALIDSMVIAWRSNNIGSPFSSIRID